LRVSFSLQIEDRREGYAGFFFSFGVYQNEALARLEAVGRPTLRASKKWEVGIETRSTRIMHFVFSYLRRLHTGDARGDKQRNDMPVSLNSFGALANGKTCGCDCDCDCSPGWQA
jgi:hypothetical protein